MTDEAAKYLPLSEAVFLILVSLASDDLHGYAIMQAVEQSTDGRVRLGPGTLYGAIKRLRKQGMIEEVEGDRSEGDERRRQYRLTPFGREVARLESVRMVEMVDAARSGCLIPSLEGR